MQDLKTYFSGKFSMRRIILIQAQDFSLSWKARELYLSILLTPARDFFNLARVAFFTQASRDN